MENYIGKLLGAKVRIHPTTHPDWIFRHDNFVLYNVPFDPQKDQAWANDTTFYVVPGLDGEGGSISFRSTSWPEHHLRHDNYAVIMQKGIEGDDKKTASWTPDAGLSPATQNDPTVFSLNSIDPIKGAVLYMASSPVTALLPVGANIMNTERVNQDTASLKIEILQAPTPVVGRWVHIASLINLKWNFTKGVEVGISTSNSFSETTTSGSSWSVSGEKSAGISAEGVSSSIKAMFSFSKNNSTSITKSNSFKKMTSETESLDMGPKNPDAYYLWQWQWESTTADGVNIVVKTDGFQPTVDLIAPVKPPE